MTSALQEQSTDIPDRVDHFAGVELLRRPRRARLLWLAALCGLLVVACVASIAIGSRSVPIGEVIAGFMGNTDGWDQAAVAKRVPRTILAVVAGAALAVSGALMQGVTRNPLADPGILGVNAGAALAVVIGIAWFGMTSFSDFIWTAIAGGAVTSVGVYAISSLGRGGPTPLKLALAGSATAAALVSFVTAILLPRGDIANSVISWQIGGVGGATSPALTAVMPFLIAGSVMAMLSVRGLNMLGLGDELAAGLGAHVGKTRLLAAVGAVVLCAATTAIAGPIGFVGLVIPHLCRMMVGPDHRWLIPFSALAGAILLTLSDVLGRVVLPPSEVDVGIITALVGAPFFILIVRRRRVREL